MWISKEQLPQGGISFDSPVISGVPQGTVQDPHIFIMLMCNINSG